MDSVDEAVMKEWNRQKRLHNLKELKKLMEEDEYDITIRFTGRRKNFQVALGRSSVGKQIAALAVCYQERLIEESGK